MAGSSGRTLREPRLEAAPCPLCGRPPQRVVRRAKSWLDEVPGTYSVRACPGCGLWITFPRPRAEDLSLAYPKGYYRTRIEDSRYPAAKRIRGALLDVGCGVGDNMVQARSQGWHCVGIELSAEAAAIARARGFEVIVGDATTVDYPQERFEVVRCWHTLEHVPDPGRLLRRLRSAVADDGVVSLLLPNRRSATSILFQRYWYHLDVPRHLHHFRPRDVAELAQEGGFEVQRIRHTANPSGLLGSIDCLVAGLSGRRRTRLRSRPRLRWTARFVAWMFARLELADVVEYELIKVRPGP
jgi:2-polyprenyl-3-methyl-5-hydroxy-6-metoxy-1,4-benzoquinol methylase